jgi:hypothetical protein
LTTVTPTGFIRKGGMNAVLTGINMINGKIAFTVL